MSHRIAVKEANSAFCLSHSRLVQIENNESTPSIYKLFALSAIYGVPVIRLLQIYLEPDLATRYHLSFEYRHTRPIEPEASSVAGTVDVPLELREIVSFQRTSLLSALVKRWGHVPVDLLRDLNLRRHRYGIIGLSDYMMYPLLRPGSIVQIDETRRPGKPRTCMNEWERPLYFVETRDAYLCCWCELSNNHLVTVPHPLSSYRTGVFRYPEEADVIGRVSRVVVRLDIPSEGSSPGVKE